MAWRPRDWGEVLVERADRQADDLSFAFLEDGERESDRLTYGQLLDRARAVAALLLDRGLAGEPVLLLYPPGLDYVVGFLGCLYAGAVAVPLYPPDPARLARTLPRLGAVAADARSRAALTTAPFAELLAANTDQVPALRDLALLGTDGLATGTAPAPAVPADGLAYLQYTSGSTGSPKGVMVGHANLLDQCADLASVWHLGADTRMVSWLPLFHDMGLIAGFLTPLWLGAPTQLMSPVSFVAKPLRWLRAVDRFGATISGAPNFAYDLCVDRIPEAERETVDLSRWRTAFNAAEPVRASTLRRFTAAFAWSGFRPEAFVPTYGLAEATLAVTGHRDAARPRVLRADADRLAAGELAAAEGSAAARELVSCGAPAPSFGVRIVDPDTREPCADGRLGELWVDGPCVTAGYHDAPAATAETFGGHTTTGDGPYLRTGDLGFRHDGEFYLASRHKDLIIVRGRNHYPSDIEQVAERADPLLRKGCVSVAATDGDDRLIILQEIREPADERRHARAVEAIRAAVTEECDIVADEVVLVARGELRKTSSGKIQRRLNRDRYLAGTLRVVATGDPTAAQPVDPEPDDPRERVRRWLAAQLPSVAGREDGPLVAAGLDSLHATTLSHALDTEFGVRVDQARLVGGLTGTALVDLVTGATATGVAPEQRQAPPGRYPLSPGQQALWFLHALDPQSAAYNQIFAATVHAELDLAALRRALDTLVARHPVLRTTYDDHDGEAAAVVHEHLAVALDEHDGTDWPEHRAADVVDAAVHRPFDLRRGPLVRVTVIRRGPAEFQLLLCVHHIAVDFWALEVLVDDLGRAYAGTPLGPVPADHVAHTAQWHRALDGATGAAAREYWTARLSGAPAALDLPVARRRPPVRGGAGDAVTVALGADLAARVRAFAAEQALTPFAVLLTAWQTLLHRYTGQDDVVVGVPTAGRGDARFAGSVGYFVNMVGMRAGFDADATFRDLVTAGAAAVTDALTHRAHPLAEVVDRLGIERDASRAPLFDTAFLVQQPRLAAPDLVRFTLGEPGGELEIGGMRCASLPVRQRLARFDLELWCTEEADGLLAALRYSTDLFDADTATRLLDGLRVLLDAALREPDTRVDRLALLSPEQHQRIVYDWNDTAAPHRDRTCLHELVEAAVDRTPDAVAVAFADRTLTFADLDARANRIAHALLADGVRPAEPVLVLVDRGLDTIPAVLGILKAGAAYVPVEPGYPDARITATRTLLGIRRALTGRAHADRLRALELDTVLAVEDTADQPDPRPALPVDPGALAYVILTSGSTGRPKGVALAHRPVVNTLDWVNTRYGIGPGDRLLFLTSLCFDLSVYDIFGMLAAGGSVRVVAGEQVADPRALLGWLAGGEITFWDSAPAALQQLVPFLSDVDTAKSALRLVFLSGDWIPVPLPDRVRAAFPAAHVVALGGATEAAIWSNYHDIGTVDPQWASIPYGRPIPNARYYVLDRHGAPCPVGVPGALYIGGECLAEGYAGDPDLTARAFGPDPFGTRPGAMRYRTGDRARFWADGTIEFLGREDSMVKIRGYRVEPGEVETLLAAHPRVREAAVVARGERDRQRLVAYLAPEETSGDPVGEWAQVFDDVYAQDADDPTLHLAGWVDGHTGVAFPVAEMREWVDTTVARIRGLGGGHVLEIGAGTGLLLSRLAPRCASYVGVDVSATAIRHLRERVAPRVGGHVELFRAAADDLGALHGRRFDVIVLNSVVQYFPDADYLAAVLRAAVALLAPGGSIMVGDVRDRTLERALRTSVALVRAAPGATAAALSATVDEESRRERELLLEPEFFEQFAARTPGLAGARVLLKEGAVANELTRFRYDVVLSTVDSQARPRVLAYSGDLGADLATLAAPGLVVTGVPDGRLAGAHAAVRALDAGADADAVRAARDTAAPGVDPGSVAGLVDGDRWRAGAARSATPGAFHLLVVPADAPWPVPPAAVTGHPLSRHANRPAHPEVTARLAGQLRDHLRALVPGYLVPSAFVVLPDGLPVTPNGKLDRAALPEPDTAAADTPYEAPADPVARELAAIWADVLGVERVGARDRFFELGGDSILSIQVVSRAGRRGIHLVPHDLFQHQTVTELADAVRERPGPDGAADSTEDSAADTGADLVPTPVQDWFRRLDLAVPGHFNQTLVFEVRDAPLDPARLARAVRTAFARHEVFRLRFRCTATEWTQWHADSPAVQVDTVAAAEPATAAERANASLDPETGPLARITLVTSGTGCTHLVAAVHHLAVDGVSWWTLVEDITAAYRDPDATAPPPTTHTAWARALARHGEDPARLAQLPAWRALLANPVPALPRDHGPAGPATGTRTRTGTGTEGDAVTARRTLDRAATERLLTGAADAYRTHTDELLLAAFATALADWGDVRTLRVDLEGHGRDAVDLDVTGTVGWFTTFTPVVLDLGTARDPGDVVPLVKEQRRAVPGAAADFGVLRARRDRPLDGLPEAEIGFNYLGRTDRIGGDLFALLPDAGGPWRAGANRRPYLWEVNCQVTGERFELAVTTTATAYPRHRVDALAEAFAAALRAVVEHCTAATAPTYTPSDFPLAGLDQDRLRAALGQFRAARTHTTGTEASR